MVIDNVRMARMDEGGGLQFPNGALEDGNLSHRVAGDLEFRTDLGLQVGGITYFVDEEFEEAFRRQ